MKNQIRSYFLLFLFLFGMLVPGQAQEELTRLPALLQHFQAHKSQHPTTSFVDYLQLHYGDDFAQHRSAHDHSKLPMKSGDHHLHAPVPVVLPKPIEIILQAVPIGTQPIVFKDQAAPKSFLTDIWQPPRSC
ncbi:MAG: hypothetical protein MUC59_01640 [Saprospiraceae bacterium]|nr:hypothetical protein [Saprospiraceae bacterium]